MQIAFRLLSALVGLLFLANGFRFIFDPAGATAELGMQLLTGAGASTQLGDIGAFFISGAIMIGLAQRTGESHWLYPPAIMVGSAAVMRTLTAVVGAADFTPQFIIPEIVMAAMLVTAARLRSDES